MICLLDTHVFIWAILSTDRLSGKAVGLITDRSNEICVSTISFWEISLKSRLGKFNFSGIGVHDFPQYAQEMDFSVITLSGDEAVSFDTLPLKENHRDPFDRMLIWQAMKRNMTLISGDSLFGQYRGDGLRLVW